MAADKPTDKYEEVFEDEEAPKEPQSMQRIRANSSIMQLKKILGEFPQGACDLGHTREAIGPRRGLSAVQRSSG